MKKWIFITATLFFAVFFFVFTWHNANKEYDRLVNHFEESIIVESSLDRRTLIRTLIGYGNQYNFDIQKIISEPDAGNGDVIHFFVHIVNEDWFEKAFRIRSALPVSGLGPGEYYSSRKHPGPGQKGTANILYPAATIDIRPLAHMENRSAEGLYFIHPNEITSDLGTIMDAINGDGQISVFREDDYKITAYNNLETLQFYLALILLALAFFIIPVLFFFNVNDAFKKTAVKKLMGYSDALILKDIVLRDILPPLCSALVLAYPLHSAYLWFANAFSGFSAFAAYSLSVLGAGVAAALSLGLCMLLPAFALLLYTFHNNRARLNTLVKGERPGLMPLNHGLKLLSGAGLLALTVPLIFSFLSMAENLENGEYWEKTKGYAFLEFFPPEHMRAPARLAAFESKGRDIWRHLDRRGGIMFLTSSSVGAEAPGSANGLPMQIPSAYVNGNYLSENPITDSAGATLTDAWQDQDENTITVLVPEKYRDWEESIKPALHAKHVHDRYISEDICIERMSDPPVKSDLVGENMGNPLIKENIVYIKNDQKFFTFGSGSSDFIEDPILLCVNADNMGNNVYFPAVMGGANGIKVKYASMDELARDTDALFASVGETTLIRNYAPVYDEKAEEIRFMQLLFATGVVLFFTAAFFFCFTSLCFIKNFLYVNRKKLSVQSLFGIGSLHKYRRFFKIMLPIDLLTLCVAGVCVLAIKVLFNRNLSLHFLLFFFVLLIIEWMFSFWSLRRNERVLIANTLKGK